MSKKVSSEHYDEEFQREAVRLLVTSGKAVPQVARELGVSAYRLRQWQQTQLQASHELGGDGTGRSTAAVEQENRQLRRELEAMRRQRDLLKKAIAICSEDGLRQDSLGVHQGRGTR